MAETSLTIQLEGLTNLPHDGGEVGLTLSRLTPPPS
jgi:hypothetical protein